MEHLHLAPTRGFNRNYNYVGPVSVVLILGVVVVVLLEVVVVLLTVVVVVVGW